MRIFGDLEINIDYNYENVLNAWTIGVCNAQFSEKAVLSFFPTHISLMFDKDKKQYLGEGTYTDSRGNVYAFSGYEFGDYSLFIESPAKIVFLRDGKQQTYGVVNEIVNTRNREIQYEMSE